MASYEHFNEACLALNVEDTADPSMMSSGALETKKIPAERG